MYSKRVLLSCTVISVQDCRFVYPSCKQCLTKLTSENQHRFRCPKCGFTCDVGNVDYRYRLSLKVARDTSLFGVTIFGGCLTPFFGITAGELHRVVETERHQGPLSLHELLIKAVDDCFIGKSFTFGFKLSGLEVEQLLLGGQTTGVSASSAHFVAYQVIPPSGPSLGITVFSYLQRLREANAQPSFAHKAVNQSQQKDSLLSCDHTLPLCVTSHFECTGGSTSPWQAMPSLVLCFSPECSDPAVHIPETDSMNESSFISTGKQNSASGQDAESVEPHALKENFIESNTGSPILSSRLSPVPIKFHLTSFSPVVYSTDTTQDPCVSKCHGCSHWSMFACKCDASLKEAGALEDAPLSESLGDFVSTVSSITDGVTPVSKRSKRLNGATLGSQSVTLHQPVRKPFCNITNIIVDEDLTTIKKQNSPGCILNTLPNSVLKRKSVPKKHIRKKSLVESHMDEYNCSADLFHQTSIDINIPDVTESPVSNLDPQKTDFCPLEQGHHLQFAPSMQSTPVSHSYRHSYKQKLELRNTRTCGSKRRKTQTNCCRVIKKHSDAAQRSKVKFSHLQSSDSAVELSKNSAIGFEMKEEIKLKDSFIIDDCSRELFD